MSTIIHRNNAPRNKIVASNVLMGLGDNKNDNVEKRINDLEEKEVDVEVTPLLSEGVHIADIKVNNQTAEIYAPQGGGQGTVTDVLVDGQSVVNQDGEAVITMPSVPSDLDDLSDVSTSSPTNGEVLKYNSTTQKWENGDAGGGNVDDVQMNGVSIVDANKIAKFNNYVELTRAEWEALPDSKYTDDILYCIKDGGSEKSNFFSPIIYSLAEREVGVWCDGKPLYQKTVKANITNSGETYVNCNVANADFCKLYDLALAAPQSRYFYNGYCLSDIYLGGFVQVTSSSVLASIYIGSSNLIRPAVAYVTIIYTKTTDNPGTGKWTTSGVPAHHYSTDEQVIGTWIDGSTLYEKTAILSYTDFVVQENVSNGRVYNLYNISGTNTQIVKVFPTAISTNYGVTSGFTQNNYDNRTNNWGFIMSYNALGLYCTSGWTIIENHVKPTVYITVQYTKTS